MKTIQVGMLQLHTETPDGGTITCEYSRDFALLEYLHRSSCIVRGVPYNGNELKAVSLFTDYGAVIATTHALLVRE